MGMIAFKVNSELHEELSRLARQLRMPRADLCRRILTGVLRDREGVQRWKDAIIGPRFDFMNEGRHDDRQ